MTAPFPLDEIRNRIAAATRSSHRELGSVALIAVSKTHPAERVATLLEQGQRKFGENRVQEALEKFPALRGVYPDLRLHLIGPLQTNKALDAIRAFDVIETLDRPRLSDAIARAAEREGRVPELLVQVNIGDEPQKTGIPKAEAENFIRACRARFGAALTGLMCIPPAQENPVPYFQALAAMAAACGLPCLSMGMSADFEAAIMAGATQVRVGSALFGERPHPILHHVTPAA